MSMQKVALSKEERRKKIKKEIRSYTRNWILYLFIIPTIIYYIMFHYMPIYGVQIAFQNYRIGETFGASEWVGLKHFIKFFESVWFTTLLKNTLSISLISYLSFPVPIILALLLNEVKNMKFRKLVQTVSYAPHFISVVILCSATKMFLSPSLGIIGMFVNNVRTSMGLDTINIMTRGNLFKWVYELSGLWQGAGWASIIYFAALAGVDPQLVEAARVDGANKVQCIWHINLPVLVPTIVIQLILKSGSILSVGYEKVYLLQNDTILRSSEVISTYVYRTGLQGAQYSFSAAVGLFNSAVNAIMLILVNTITRKISRDNSLW